MAFPTNPSVGDTFTTGSKSYRWDGNVWSRSTDSLLTTANITESGSNFFYSNTRVKNYLGNFDGPLVPASDEGYNLGSSAKKWANLFLSGNTLVLGQTKIESSGDGSIAIKSTNAQVTTAISFASNGYIAAPSGPLATASGSVSATPRIANVLVTDGSYNYLDDTAANSQGYVEINGANFDNGATVIIGTTSASSVTFVNSTRLRVNLPTLSAGTYPVYVVNSDGSTATRINGLNISGTPLWTTASGNINILFERIFSTTNVNATSDSNIYYSVLSGSLPTGLILTSSNGTISGRTVLTNSNTIFNFTINASDLELQNTTRNFSITVTPDQIVWVNPNTTQQVNVVGGSSYNTNLLAVSTIGDSITSYTANSVPPGFSLTGNVLTGTANVSGLPNVNNYFTSIITATSNNNRIANITFAFNLQKDVVTAEVLMIAGGGGGGRDAGGGGGGAGGYVCSTVSIDKNVSCTIVVGAGGTASPTSGGNTCAFGLISYGGGYGGGSFSPGAPGGSGGGAGGLYFLPAPTCWQPTKFGGANVSSQGFPGGCAVTLPPGTGDIGRVGGGGGGGGSQAGTNGCINSFGVGGCGRSSDISGSLTFYSGGGGGGAGSGSGGAGGCGGGGPSSTGYTSPGTPGTACTGGGGGGGTEGSTPGGSGGSGIVYLRYPSACPLAKVNNNGVYCISNGYHVYRWVATGNITF